MRRAGVVGVDVGFRMSEGRYVLPPRYAIRIDVEARLAPAQLRRLRRKRFPRRIEGIEVNVVERRYVCRSASATTTPRVAPEWMTRRDPIVGGVAIGLAEPTTGSGWGTLGCVVFRGNSPLYLTNAHLVQSSSRETDRTVRQPPLGPDAHHPDAVIGYVVDPPVLTEGVDAAVIHPTGRAPAQHIRGLMAGAIYETRRLGFDDEGMTIVYKIGAKTSGDPPPMGLVDNVAKTVSVPGLGTFHGQILVWGDRPLFQDEGDSGAVLVVPRRRRGATVYQLVGLCFAASDDYQTAVACHFVDVLGELGATVNPE